MPELRQELNQCNDDLQFCTDAHHELFEMLRDEQNHANDQANKAMPGMMRNMGGGLYSKEAILALSKYNERITSLCARDVAQLRSDIVRLAGM